MSTVTRLAGRALVRLSHKRKVTQASLRNMLRLTNRERRATDVFTRTVLRITRLEDVRGIQTYARHILRLTPDFRWIDMFSDKVFPNDISENSDAATRFNTQVNQVASGHDQRIALWDYPMMEYNVAYGVRTMEDLHDLIRFFRVMRGKLVAFRFLDHIDHQSNFAVYDESRAPDPTEPTDQLIGTGNDIDTAFQLVKHYDFEDETSTRPIYKPIEGTVEIAIEGAEIEYFEVDHSTGIVTIVPRVAANIQTATLEKLGANLWRVAVPTYAPGPPVVGTPLPIFLEDEWIDVTGFAYGAIERGVVTASTVNEVQFTLPATPGTAIGVVQAGAAARVASDNTPRIGEEVTAGFSFHVPVRFNTDRIPVRLEYYGVGSASDITLVEVRPDEED